MNSVLAMLTSDAGVGFCRRWEIKQLAVFGSVSRDDFAPESDVDVLVTFDPSARWGLLKLVQAQMELEELLGRKVDLCERQGVEGSRNWRMRREILSTARVVYEAG